MATQALNTDSPDLPKWVGPFANGDVGARWEMGQQYRTASFQVTGTFGVGGSIQMEGSNDGTNWAKTSAAALTQAGFLLLAVNECCKYLRPHVTAGDGTTALVVIGFSQNNL